VSFRHVFRSTSARSRTERLLRDFGVDHPQELLIGKPRPVSEVLQLH
jgi:hypothetical protein